MTVRTAAQLKADFHGRDPYDQFVNLVDSVPAIAETETQKYIWVSKGGNDTTGDGTRHKPFLTITAALAAVTSSIKMIMVMPGSYAEATGVTWPLISGVQLIGVGNRWETGISAGAGDQVINIAPGVQASTFEATIQNIQIDHDETGQDGLVLTHTSVGKKLNIYLGNVGMDGDGADYGLKVVHGGSGNAVRVYWDGGNGSIPSKIDLDSEDGGDRFYAENVMFEADIDAGAADTTLTIQMFNCQILHEGFSGGGGTTVVVLGGCRSKTSTTYAVADDTDVTANSSITGPTTFP